MENHPSTTTSLAPFPGLSGRHWEAMVSCLERRTMASKKKKTPKISKRQKRRIRLQQILFAFVAIAVIASFVISLLMM
jgi:hypothetical protein